MKQLALFVVLALVPLVFALDGDTFTVNCAPLTIQRSDPIIFPGTAGAHVHSIIGGNAFQRSMQDKFSPNNATATTCDKAIDHSNYWVPQLYHYANGEYTMVKFSGSAVYYQKRACDYAPNARSCDKSFVPRAPPYGLRMVAGDPSRRTQNSSDFAQKAITIMCIYDGGSVENPGFPTRKCNDFRSQVYFPSCWDGVNLDTPNHQTHVAYPAIGDYNGGVCPASHPYAIFSVFYEFHYDVSSYNDINRFAFANGDNTGYGFHGDYMMGWTDINKLQTAHRDCINAANCPNLGNQPANAQTLIHPAPNDGEDIGLNNPIKELPGNNHINWNGVTDKSAHQHIITVQ